MQTEKLAEEFNFLQTLATSVRKQTGWSLWFDGSCYSNQKIGQTTPLKGSSTLLLAGPWGLLKGWSSSSLTTAGPLSAARYQPTRRTMRRLWKGSHRSPTQLSMMLLTHQPFASLPGGRLNLEECWSTQALIRSIPQLVKHGMRWLFHGPLPRAAAGM